MSKGVADLEKDLKEFYQEAYQENGGHQRVTDSFEG